MVLIEPVPLGILRSAMHRAARRARPTLKLEPLRVGGVFDLWFAFHRSSLPLRCGLALCRLTPVLDTLINKLGAGAYKGSVSIIQR